MNWDTAIGVSVKMFDVPGQTIQPSFADADEQGTMDFVSFASTSLTHAQQPQDPAFGDDLASERLSPQCLDAALKKYENSVKRAQAVNAFSPLENAEDFFNTLFGMRVPNFTTPPFYDFTATGQHAFQFGEPTEPAFKWFWHLPGPKIEHSCNGNGEECISVAGFRNATAHILERPLELSLWGHLQGKDDPVEQDNCWKPSDPTLLGKLVMKQHEEPKTCEYARFTPWHAPVEHRPLGSIGRMRGPIYRDRQEARRSLPCNSLDECRQNGEKRYPAPSTVRFAFAAGPAQRQAAYRLSKRAVWQKFSGGRRRVLMSDHGEDISISAAVTGAMQEKCVGNCQYCTPHGEMHTNVFTDMPLCENGEYHWACVSRGRGPRVQCPAVAPMMCANKRCDNGLDYCCEVDCGHGGSEPFGGPRLCDLT